MAPLCEFVQNNNNIEVLKAALVAIDENFRAEKQKELVSQLKQINKELINVERQMGLAIRAGNLVAPKVAKHRKHLRVQKAKVASELKTLR